MIQAIREWLKWKLAGDELLELRQIKMDAEDVSTWCNYEYPVAGEVVRYLIPDEHKLGRLQISFFRRHIRDNYRSALHITSDDIQVRILDWAKERNFFGEGGSDAKSQMVKLAEEFGELAAGIARGDEQKIIDSLGDMQVVMTLIASYQKTTLLECLHVAWEEIRDRKGQMRDGVFVKEEDMAHG